MKQALPKQKLKLKSQILERRRDGEAVSGTWTKARIKFICEQDKPAGYNSEKHKFTNHWFTNFLNRQGLSIRKKTNKKKLRYFNVYIKLIITNYTVFISLLTIQSALNRNRNLSLRNPAQNQILMIMLLLQQVSPNRRILSLIVQ